MNNITMQKVESSQIAEIGHDPVSSTLAIRFKSGGLYHYANVGLDTFAALRDAASVGSYFYKSIKPFVDKFPYTKIEEAKQVA